jgi:hypothetical protein
MYVVSQSKVSQVVRAAEEWSVAMPYPVGVRGKFGDLISRNLPRLEQGLWFPYVNQRVLIQRIEGTLSSEW